jgi:hypothetical protein
VSRVPHIFRWDLDKTYLKSDFETLRDLVKTARLTAEQRENVPGSAALLRAIREDPRIDGKVYFISGSPSHMRAVLERKFELDGVEPDGFVLKPTLSHMLRGRFRAVRGQVAYKIGQLLQGRSHTPIGTVETLFGDDAENDAFIYSLYADVLAGRVPREVLHEVLRRSGAYPFQIDEIDGALETVVREDPVQRIVIHLDQRTPPETFLPFFPRLVPIHSHLQTAMILYLDGTLDRSCIQRVAWELIGRYGGQVEALADMAEDLLRRRRQHLRLDFVAQLATDLRAMVGAPDPDGRGPNGADRIQPRVDALLEAIAQRAESVRQADAEPPPAEGDRDYVALWENEMSLMAQRRRRRKAGELSEAAPKDEP